MHQQSDHSSDNVDQVSNEIVILAYKSSTTALRTKPQVMLIEKSGHNSYYVHQRAEDSCDMSLNGQNTVVMCPSSIRA